MKRLSGFSVYVSNSTRIQSGDRCYHHAGPEYPELYQDIVCNAVGRYVTVFIQRPPDPKDSVNLCHSTKAVLELCEVEVFGM